MTEKNKKEEKGGGKFIEKISASQSK